MGLTTYEEVPATAASAMEAIFFSKLPSEEWNQFQQQHGAVYSHFQMDILQIAGCA